MTGDENSEAMGRPPAVDDDELVEALQSVLHPLAESAATTQEVIDALDTMATDKTVVNRLRQASEDESVPISGKKGGTGWVWWLTDADLYDHLSEN